MNRSTSLSPLTFPSSLRGRLLAFSLAIPVLIFATVGVGFTVYTMNVGADALVRMPGRGGGNSDGLVTAADAARYWLRSRLPWARGS